MNVSKTLKGLSQETQQAIKIALRRAEERGIEQGQQEERQKWSNRPREVAFFRVTFYEDGNHKISLYNETLPHDVKGFELPSGRLYKYTTSNWKVTLRGPSLESFYDEDHQGWEGQYTAGKWKYDEIPKALLTKHYNAMLEWVKKEFCTLWLPCHIYDDMNAVLYRP